MFKRLQGAMIITVFYAVIGALDNQQLGAWAGQAGTWLQSRLGEEQLEEHLIERVQNVLGAMQNNTQETSE